MNLLQSSNLIFTVLGRAADAATANSLANADQASAINSVIASSGADSMSNAAFVNQVWTNAMGPSMANSPLTTIWTMFLDMGLVNKAAFVGQTLNLVESFSTLAAANPVLASVPFVQTFVLRSEVSLNTASNTGNLNNASLTALLQATTDAASATAILNTLDAAKSSGK